MYWYPRYVPVGVRRARAHPRMRELRAQGMKLQPIELRSRDIAGTFWGRRWCEHLESFSDYANRLPRGRTYVRNGSVCHLAIEAGTVEAMVIGQELYQVVVRIRPLERPAWKAIRTACAGQIGSVLELLQGRLSERAMDVVAHRDTGLFPQPAEIELVCDCPDGGPDGVAMCKHAAAVLYGVGSRLDDSPELLFRLRGVDAAELMAADVALPGGAATADALADDDLGSVFGIDLDPEGSGPAPDARKPAGAADRGGAAGARRPAAGADPDGAASVPRQAEDTDPDGANRGTGANARQPTAHAAPGSRRSKNAQKAPTPPSREAGSRAEPPRQEAPGAAVPRFRPTGAQIAGLRERGGFSVAEFAELLRVSAATVRRWEGAPGPLGLHARSREALKVLRLEIEKPPE